MIGKNNPNWKGDKASYPAIHAWVKRHRGRPSKCEHCGTTTAKKFEWANKSHKYLRKLSDWLRLCTSCHIAYDKKEIIKKMRLKRNHWDGRPKRKGIYSSIYKGICWDKIHQKWTAQIKTKGKQIYIGSFQKELHAAMAYDIWAKELFGKLTGLNFKGLQSLS